jgi:menaquinone-dependent protoporphyrinogen oxidase
LNTLIVYATKHGSAKECAETLTKGLSGKVDVYNLKENGALDLSKYDKVIIGGSIYAGTMHKEIKDFCTKNLDELKNKKLGFFICCMNKKEAEKQLNNAFPQELLDIASVKKSFGGQFKFKEMNFLEKLITKMVSKALAKEDPSLAVDTKKDISMLSQENISEFVSLMNSAS